MLYEFTITMIGEGKTVDVAWQEACMELAMCPGDAPDRTKNIIDEEHETDPNFCPDCGQHFFAHNDDGSCVKD